MTKGHDKSYWTKALGALMLTCAIGFVAGCGSGSSDRSSPPPATVAELETYPLKGTIVAVDKPGKRLTVNHEDIPGFMTAMTMAYPVKDAQLLETLAPGQRITAKVVGNAGGYWLEKIAIDRDDKPK